MQPIIRAFGLTPVRHPTSQLIRYGIVAGCGYLLAIAFYAGELAVGIAPYLAFGIVFVVNGLFNFALIRAWAFPPSGRSIASDLRRFCVVAAASFVVNYASFATLYSAIGLGAATAQRLAILIAAPLTFLANRMWSFGVRPSTRVADVQVPTASIRDTGS
ncbi:MAG TPA: GtrA family protein [Solirubrobacteraceae bacterium]|nr:GtrA family protein [Solirubrobacteraceae bacterium]